MRATGFHKCGSLMFLCAKHALIFKESTKRAAQQSHHAVDDSVSKCYCKQLLDFLSRHEEMQQQLVVGHDMQTSASLLGGKPATDNCFMQLRSLIPSPQVSWQNQNFYRFLEWWKIVSHAQTMFVEYVEAVLCSCSILAPSLSS